MPQLQDGLLNISTVIPTLWDIFWAFIIFVIGRWLARRSRSWFKATVQKTHVRSNEKLIYATERIIYYGILIIALSLSLVVLGVPLYSLISIFAIVVIFVAIAMQTSLNNFAATVIFLAYQTFKPGDWVDVLGGTFGQVKEIQMFGTVIVTQEKSTVTVPNGVVLEDNIINYSELGYRRVDIVVTITYQADLHEAKLIMEQVLDENEQILDEPDPVVGVMFLGDKGIDFSLRAFTAPEAYWDTLFQVTERVKLRLNEAGIETPVFQQEIHIIQPE